MSYVKSIKISFFPCVNKFIPARAVLVIQMWKSNCFKLSICCMKKFLILINIIFLLLFLLLLLLNFFRAGSIQDMINQSFEFHETIAACNFCEGDQGGHRKLCAITLPEILIINPGFYDEQRIKLFDVCHFSILLYSKHLVC